MRIGISSGISNSPNSATFAEVVASLGYDYTWAYDASKQTTLASIGGAATFGASIAEDGTGIKIDFTGNKGTTQFSFGENAFTAGSVSSSGSGTQIIPDGAMAVPSAAEGHPGRYLSVVVTINSLTIADGSIGGAAVGETGGSTLFGFIVTTSIGIALLSAGYANPSDAQYINGTARSGAFSQSEIDGLIGSPIAITWDMGQATSYSASDDPTAIISYPASNEDVTMDAIIHGFIFSATPPNIAIDELPVHIAAPTVSGE